MIVDTEKVLREADGSVKLIDRKNNAINCINCVLICSEVYRQLSSPFALEISLGQWSRCTESRRLCSSGSSRLSPSGSRGAPRGEHLSIRVRSYRDQLTVYGAVAAVCEEFEGHQDRTGEPVILMGQSIVLGEVKAEDPLQNENSMNDQIIWQQYIQQVESLSPENKVSKFCKEARFMRVVEVGQYFHDQGHW